MDDSNDPSPHSWMRGVRDRGGAPRRSFVFVRAAPRGFPPNPGRRSRRPGGARSRVPTGATRRAHESSPRFASSTPSSASPGTTLEPSRPGLACACRPRPSGSSRPDAWLEAKVFRWGEEREPGASTKGSSGRRVPHRQLHRRWLRWHRSRRCVSGQRLRIAHQDRQRPGVDGRRGSGPRGFAPGDVDRDHDPRGPNEGEHQAAHVAVRRRRVTILQPPIPGRPAARATRQTVQPVTVGFRRAAGAEKADSRAGSHL